MDQRADITVVREKDSLFGDRLGQQGFIAGIRRPLADIRDVVASIAEGAKLPAPRCWNRQARAHHSPAIVRPSAAATSGALHKAGRRRCLPARARDKLPGRLLGWRHWRQAERRSPDAPFRRGSCCRRRFRACAFPPADSSSVQRWLVGVENFSIPWRNPRRARANQLSSMQRSLGAVRFAVQGLSRDAGVIRDGPEGPSFPCAGFAD
jgi:hypothetical protein